MSFTPDELQAFNDIFEKKLTAHRREMESIVDRALAAQLLAMQEMLDQHFSLQPDEDSEVSMSEHTPQFETIEVQTDLPWEDLIDIFGKVLDERFTLLNDSTQSAMRNLEQYFVVQMRSMQTQLHDIALHNRQAQTQSGNITNMQEVFQSIEELERIIESMQVAMTANHALLSNRLYHHQQMSLERAHGNNPTPQPRLSHPNGTTANNPLSLNSERGG